MDLDALLTHTADGVCAIGVDGRIVFWNRSAERLLGYAGREVIGKRCCDVFVGRDPAGNRLCYQGCHVQTLVKRGETVEHFEMATRTKAGRPVWLDISILVVPGTRPDGRRPFTSSATSRPRTRWKRSCGSASPRCGPRPTTASRPRISPPAS